MNSKDVSNFEDIFSEDFVDHSIPEQLPGPQAQREHIEGILVSFPDLSVMNDAPDFAEADTVAVVHHFSGTHQGTFLAIEPTGRKVQGTAIDTWLVRDGQIAAVWHVDELLQVVGQLTSAEPIAMFEPMAMVADLGTGDSEANKALAERFYEAFNSRAFDDYASCIAADVIDHNPGPKQMPGLEGLKGALQGFTVVFPDLQITIEDVISEEDLVLVRGTATGNHEGEFLGVAPTGKVVTFGYNDVYRIKDDVITEAWHVKELLQVLGILSAEE